MNTPNEKQLVDEAIDAYVDWRQECAAVWDAYQSWAQASVDEDKVAFSGYRAALDREERASHVYALLVTQITTPPPDVADVLGPASRALAW
jgi:hypothetical protein